MAKILIKVVEIVLLLPTIALAFTPPDEKTIRNAIGDLNGLPAALQRAFTPDKNSFDPIPEPRPADWLAVHNERGQTFDEFKGSQPNRPTQNQHVIYLQPLEDFAPEHSPSNDKLREFAAAFFAMEVKVLPPVKIGGSTFVTRRNPFTNNPQILTNDVSFARYDPAFYGEPRAPGYEVLLLRRSCKVLAHETGHMFGLAHCTYFNCLMNGSNHLVEADRRPLHLCPVCLRKLQSSIGFDVLQRYSALEGICRVNGFTDEADWLTRRLENLQRD
jgi:archaemetzincin